MTKCGKKEKTLNAKLFVRILPTIDMSYDSIKIENNRQVIYVRCLQDLSKGVCVKNPNYWSFCTDGIFWNSCQAEVFDAVTSGWLDYILEGVSAMIVSYGQTGSGKTTTTSGLRHAYENRGLILRVLSQLLEEEEQRRDVTKIYFGMSYLEFIGETVRDLISNKAVDKVGGVIEYPLLSEEWAWKNIFKAECRKSYSVNAPYKGSNKGHSVLTFYIHAESLIDTDPVITHSKIHIVDMAGVDNFGNHTSGWKDKWDLGQSNLSKCLMEQLIICLTGDSWKSQSHICPYKSSRFLMYLHDTLSPSCLVSFIAHINGSENNLPQTLSTLKFGEKLKSFRPMKLERIVESNCVLRMRNLEKENIRLKEEAELTGMLRDAPNYCNMSQERLLQIKRAAEGYLFGQLENLTLFSFGTAALTLDVFKELYYKLSAEKDQMIKDAVTTATEILQNQLATERNSNTSTQAIGGTQRISRRRSRQRDSLVFGSSYRSTDSIQASVGKIQSSVQQAGVSDRKGISIGPGKISTNYEGNITKALKKLRSKRSDSLIMKSARSFTNKDNGLPQPKAQTTEEISELSLPDSVPSKEKAWQNFNTENSEWVCELRANIEKHEEAAKASRKQYLATVAEVCKIREDIEEAKSELENCIHVRQIFEKGELDEEGNPLPGDFEKEFMNSIAEKQDRLNISIENCHIALIDFRTLVDGVIEAKKALEDAFQEYCKTNYKTVFISEEFNSPDFESDDSKKETTSEIEQRHQALVALYSELQNKLNNYVPKMKRNEWRNY